MFYKRGNISGWTKFKYVAWTIVLTTLAIILYANLRMPQKSIAYQIQGEVAVEDPRFPYIVGKLLSPPFSDGNKIETLLNGEEIFPAMLSAIKNAKENITFESYIYWSGKIGKEFAEALTERAKNGVNVHVMLDWAGSGKIDKDFLETMKSGGVEIQRYHIPRWYNITRMNNRTHRKLLIIDGKIGFTGGVGIADEWTGNGLDKKHWRETHYKIEGPVVNQMQSAFMDNWLKTQSQVHISPKYFPEVSSKGGIKAQMFISSAEEGGSSARILYLLAIASAKKSIHLESAYFVPDEHTNNQLIEAKKRGVDIQIIVPGPYTDSSVADYASRDGWEKLLKAGIKIYLYQPALFHCKVLVVDRYFSSVGSTNFDERSFRLNDEANLNILDKNFAEEQIKSFDADLKNSKEFTYEDWKNRPLTEKIWSKIMMLFSSQL